MRVLIGTPVNEVKDYSMERWFKNVTELKHPAELMLVDNSPNFDYMEKVKKYCQDFGIKKYKLIHLQTEPGIHSDRKVEQAQELIRQEVLMNNHDAWFSWECDQIIPPDALDKLVKVMQDGDFSMVNHNGWSRGHPDIVNTNFGVSLLRRDILEKFSFLMQFGDDPKMFTGWTAGEYWFKNQALKAGFKFSEVEGLISPIYHLDK